MGLMNVGKSEGPEIIQLFGRGVRLKGYGMCLKRSSQIDVTPKPPHIGLLETLNIFGIRAQYMQQFKEYLEDEGLPSNEERIEFILPVVKNLDDKKLTSIRLKEGVDFKRQCEQKPTLDEPNPFGGNGVHPLRPCAPVGGDRRRPAQEVHRPLLQASQAGMGGRPPGVPRASGRRSQLRAGVPPADRPVSRRHQDQPRNAEGAD